VGVVDLRSTVVEADAIDFNRFFGEVYVVDFNSFNPHNVIHVYDLSFHFKRNIVAGGPGYGVPEGIVRDPESGDLFLPTHSGVIRRFRIDGAFLSEFAVGGAANGLTYDPQNRTLWVTNFNSRSVEQWTLDGTFVSSFHPAPLDSPVGAAFNPVRRTIFVAENSSDEVREFTLDGTDLGSFVPPNPGTSNGLGIYYDAVSGNLYYGQQAPRLDVFRDPARLPVLASDQASVTVIEGQTAANTGTVNDANHDSVTLTASVGSVVNHGDGTWSWSFATSDGPSESQTVTITGDDGHSGTSSTSFSLVVNNVAPAIANVSNNGPVFIGNPATVTLTATDPAGTNDPLAYSFDCNNDGIFEIGPQAGNSASCTFATDGKYTVNVRVADDDGGVTLGWTVVTVLNSPPDCSHATANPRLLWPPNHQLVPIQFSGIVNPAGGTVAISVTRIFQDEPVQGPGSGNTSPDATVVGTATPSVRAERDGGGDGRVYHITFIATGASGTCTGTVTIGVPHDQGANGGPVDQGALYDSTQR
jgi:hypothetical protein